MKEKEIDKPSTQGVQNINKTKEWPYTDAHHLFIDKLSLVVEKYEQSRISSNHLAKKLDYEEGVPMSETTMRAWLSTHREYIEENTDLSSVEIEDGSPGSTAVYWRLDK